MMKKIYLLIGSIFFVLTAYGQQSTTTNVSESKLLRKQVNVNVPIIRIKNKAMVSISREYANNNKTETQKIVIQPISNKSSVKGTQNDDIYLKENPKK